MDRRYGFARRIFDMDLEDSRAALDGNADIVDEDLAWDGFAGCGSMSTAWTINPDPRTAGTTNALDRRISWTWRLCPLWVKSGHSPPICPMSALRQKRTFEAAVLAISAPYEAF